MQCLEDGRRARYYCKPADESAAAADRASYAPDMSCAYKYVYSVLISSPVHSIADDRENLVLGACRVRGQPAYSQILRCLFV